MITRKIIILKITKLEFTQVFLGGYKNKHTKEDRRII